MSYLDRIVKRQLAEIADASPDNKKKKHGHSSKAPRYEDEEDDGHNPKRGPGTALGGGYCSYHKTRGSNQPGKPWKCSQCGHGDSKVVEGDGYGDGGTAGTPGGGEGSQSPASPASNSGTV